MIVKLDELLWSDERAKGEIERNLCRLKCKTDSFVFSIQQGMRIVMRTDRRDAKGEG